MVPAQKWPGKKAIKKGARQGTGDLFYKDRKQNGKHTDRGNQSLHGRTSERGPRGLRSGDKVGFLHYKAEIERWKRLKITSGTIKDDVHP